MTDFLTRYSTTLDELTGMQGSLGVRSVRLAVLGSDHVSPSHSFSVHSFVFAFAFAVRCHRAVGGLGLLVFDVLRFERDRGKAQGAVQTLRPPGKRGG